MSKLGYTIFVLVGAWVAHNSCDKPKKICGTLRRSDSDDCCKVITTTKDKLTENISSMPIWHKNVPLIEEPSYDVAPEKHSCILVRNDIPVCSCVIFNENFALTACDQCLRSRTEHYIPEDYVLKYTNLDDENSPSIEMKIVPLRRLICHPAAYNAKHGYQVSNDIGMVQTKIPIQLPTWYFPSLPENDAFEWDITEQLHLSNLNSDNPYPPTGRDAIWYILTKIVNGRFCKNILEKFEDDLFCIAYEHVNGNNCALDVGSGLVVRDNADNVLIGLLISKRGCGTARSVAGCVKTSKFLQWIEDSVARYET